MVWPGSQPLFGQGDIGRCTRSCQELAEPLGDGPGLAATPLHEARGVEMLRSGSLQSRVAKLGVNFNWPGKQKQCVLIRFPQPLKKGCQNDAPNPGASQTSAAFGMCLGSGLLPDKISWLWATVGKVCCFLGQLRRTPILITARRKILAIGSSVTLSHYLWCGLWCHDKRVRIQQTS